MLDNDRVSCDMKLVSHSCYHNVDSELVLLVKINSYGLLSSSVLVANIVEVLSAYIALLTHTAVQACILVCSCFSA